ncbi:LytR/AlgR family response regulator transcription factor [Paenibacillus sp. 481]|uniref:LytR/AlgR family response regulator transcription factor n=1 Tax=Paenibacillus sp. 481 TaxID=2835869 RepID=UPI001E3B9D3A|nr:LytTR family DNA-binding domain-containing protein [Paenibacillus sp. 481]UHA71668.1 response regulator transcription factor [Paenibacillus sp. 481]
MSWTILIVEDEPLAREDLAHTLSLYHEELEIVQAATGTEALQLVQEREPKLIFLDINLPDISGLQVAEHISAMPIKHITQRIPIIFCTAYDEYALQAFQLRAYHYLLKPYDEQDIYAILKELQFNTQLNTQVNNRMNTQNTSQTRPSSIHACKLALPNENVTHYVMPEHIIFLEKQDKHVRVVTTQGTYFTTRTLQELERRLEPYLFFRCHKSFVISMRHAEQLSTYTTGTFNLLMSEGSTVPVSRNYVKELRYKLEI